MHGGPGDENYNRGYEWWLMKEAKARKPDIKLYGLPWGWPGWLDPAATATKQAQNAFANPAVTANYTLAWLLGAKRVHGLDIDYMGQWNERDAPKAYNDALRLAVNTSALSATTTVLNRLPHYPGTAVAPDSKGCTQVGEKRCIFNIFYTESRRIMLTCVHTVHSLHAVRMEHNRRLAVGG